MDYGKLAGVLATVGATGYGMYESRNQRQQAADIYRQQAEREYDAYMQNYNAVKDYNDRAFQMAGANRAASAARAAAARAVAQANENQRAALAKKAGKTLEKSYRERIAALQPYTEAALRLLPQKTDTYSQGLGATSQLLKQMMTPERLGMMMAQPRSSSMVPLALPAYLQGANVK